MTVSERIRAQRPGINSAYNHLYSIAFLTTSVTVRQVLYGLNITDSVLAAPIDAAVEERCGAAHHPRLS